MRHVFFVTSKLESHPRSNVIHLTIRQRTTPNARPTRTMTSTNLLNAIDALVPNLFPFIALPGETSLRENLTEGDDVLLSVFIIQRPVSNVGRSRSFAPLRYTISIDTKSFVQTNWTLGPLSARGSTVLHEQYVNNGCVSLPHRGPSVLLLLQVTLKKTGQIMVMKETKTFDKEAQKIFVKEVKTPRWIDRFPPSNRSNRFKCSNV